MLDKYGSEWFKDEDGELGFIREDEWYKENFGDAVWWKDTPDSVGELIFSFDKKQEFNLFADYPHNLTAEQVQIFDKENPEWVNFFKDRKQAVT